MNSPLHHFCLEPAPLERSGEIVRLVSLTDVEWGRPVFCAPDLPTLQQINSELPFSVNFPSKRQRMA